jgi:phosphoglycolate phosphatase-like HAD superfamily hydrolase
MSTTVLEHESSLRQPKSIELDGLGEVHGWANPSYSDATSWEIKHDIDVLGPDFERYDGNAERVVLDWDDTMKNTGKWWIVAHREVLQSFGFDDEETSDESILRLFGNIHVGDTLGIERFVREDKQYTDDEIWGLIKGRAGELLAEDPMDPLVVKAIKLAASSGSARFAVWSSSPRELLMQAIEANGLEDVFDAVVSVDDVTKHKPDPEGLLKAVRAMDEARGYIEAGEDYSDDKPLRMNGVWMVGDSPNDTKGGKAVGASTLWLEHPLQAHSAMEKRQKLMKEALALGSAAAAQTVRDLMPTGALRTYDPQEAGLDGKFSVTQIPREEIANLTTYNVGFARFLMDKQSRAGAYRIEKVYDVLSAQIPSGAEPKLTGVFADASEEINRTAIVKPQPLNEAQVNKMFDDIVWSIHENTIGY